MTKTDRMLIFIGVLVLLIGVVIIGWMAPSAVNDPTVETIHVKFTHVNQQFATLEAGFTSIALTRVPENDQ